MVVVYKNKVFIKTYKILCRIKTFIRVDYVCDEMCTYIYDDVGEWSVVPCSGECVDGCGDGCVENVCGDKVYRECYGNVCVESINGIRSGDNSIIKNGIRSGDKVCGDKVYRDVCGNGCVDGISGIRKNGIISGDNNYINVNNINDNSINDNTVHINSNNINNNSNDTVNIKGKNKKSSRFKLRYECGIFSNRVFYNYMCYNTRNIYDIGENCNSKEENCNSNECSTDSIDSTVNIKNDNIKECSTNSIDSTFNIKKDECNISSSTKNTLSTENVPLKNTSTKTSFENYPSSTKKTFKLFKKIKKCRRLKDKPSEIKNTKILYFMFLKIFTESIKSCRLSKKKSDIDFKSMSSTNLQYDNLQSTLSTHSNQSFNQSSIHQSTSSTHLNQSTSSTHSNPHSLLQSLPHPSSHINSSIHPSIHPPHPFSHQNTIQKAEHILDKLKNLHKCTILEDNGTDGMIFMSQHITTILSYSLLINNIYNSFSIHVSIGISCGMYFILLNNDMYKFMGNALNTAARMSDLGKGVYCCECVVIESDEYVFSYVGERVISGYSKCLKIYKVHYRDCMLV
ncbi:hypothetical protein NAPIS_ORF02644 [Vairimorpha apis BRL 01]|uniref:Guanylate cyclase domain-containing protein n=1 Tax=Vairimorpha apis BRL 01 TaxID=1037528 RepID=T0M8P7_9MICR|nr:hypothetical protein NAPIS_ORF02644 [Vairimorpha apis BRL 01]